MLRLHLWTFSWWIQENCNYLQSPSDTSTTLGPWPKGTKGSMTEKEAHVTQVTVTFPDDISHNGVCEARTPNEESWQLPSTGTVTPPEKAQLRIRTNSINGTRSLFFSSPLAGLTNRPLVRDSDPSTPLGRDRRDSQEFPIPRCSQNFNCWINWSWLVTGYQTHWQSLFWGSHFG